MSWYRIKVRLLTKWEKHWFEQMLATHFWGTTARNRRVFLRYLKCGTYAATGDYFGMTKAAVNVHVVRTLRAFDRMSNKESWFEGYCA